MCDTVGWLTPERRAISAADLRPETTLSAISLRLVSSSFFRRPPIRPSALSRRCPLADHGALELGEDPASDYPFVGQAAKGCFRVRCVGVLHPVHRSQARVGFFADCYKVSRLDQPVAT
jgi:hypothetical protein